MTTKEAASVRYLCASLTLLALAHGAVGQTPPMPTELSSEEVIARVAPSVAVVLTGAGAGRLSGATRFSLADKRWGPQRTSATKHRADPVSRSGKSSTRLEKAV